jgi:hypothetical protein
MMEITLAQYDHHRGEYDGFCLACQTITNLGGVEPDATNYECDECGEKQVVGMDLALVMDQFEFID